MGYHGAITDRLNPAGYVNSLQLLDRAGSWPKDLQWKHDRIISRKPQGPRRPQR